MLKSSRVVTSTSCPSTTSPQTCTCTFTPTAATTAAVPMTTTPTATDLAALAQQLGMTGAAATPLGAAAANPFGFLSPEAALAPLNPFAALAAANPLAALTALSPSLNIFNPAINPNAALLAFNPTAANTLALSSNQGLAAWPFGKLPPFGKGFAKPFGGI